MCVSVRDHLRAVKEPESALVTEVLTATGELLRHIHTYAHTKPNEVVDWVYQINCSIVV